MGEKEANESTAKALILLARARGIDISSHFHAESFWSTDSDRHIVFKWDEGELLFHLAGRVLALPMQLKGTEAPSNFASAYSESGVVHDLEGAYSLLKAWLFDQKEVDDLPARISNKLGTVG